MHFNKAFGALALASSALAQNVTHCVSGDVCYAVNIPELTASSGNGDIFIQMSGPSTMSWIGMGQGSSMTGSNIFVAYSNGAGTNVTLSPRLGVGNRAPALTSTAEVTLLEGSGISNGMMTANFKCSNCASWQGGSMNFSNMESNWIWGYLVGQQLESDSLQAGIRQHTNYGTMRLNLQSATGGRDKNPFLAASASVVPPSESGSNSGSSSTSTELSESGVPANFSMILMAHGILGPIAFVLFFPLGAITMRLFSFKGLVWFHAGWMVFTYLIVLAAMGLGVWIADTLGLIHSYHAIIGLVVVGLLLLQPVTGLLHHRLYKRSGGPNTATYPHVWWGRTIITLGIINGGLGLKLADNTRNGEIAYGVVAGFMWLLWMGVIIFAFVRSKKNNDGSGSRPRGSKEEMRHSESLQQNSPTRNSYSGQGNVPTERVGTAV